MNTTVDLAIVPVSLRGDGGVILARIAALPVCIVIVLVADHGAFAQRVVLERPVDRAFVLAFIFPPSPSAGTDAVSTVRSHLNGLGQVAPC